MGENMKRTNIYLDDDDRRAIAVIQEAHGLERTSTAVRLALREVSRQILSGKRRARRATSGPTREG